MKKALLFFVIGALVALAWTYFQGSSSTRCDGPTESMFTPCGR